MQEKVLKVISSQFAATVAGADFPSVGSFEVLNPATMEIVGYSPITDPARLDEVFAAASAALPEWQRDDDTRRTALRAAATEIDGAAAEISRLLTQEQGKPLPQAERELSAASEWLRYYADLEIRPEIVRDDDQGYEAVIKRPLGVVSAITPWNSPIALAMWKIAPALRAGNSMVLKPSPFTPLSTLALATILRGVLPDGVLNVVTGPEPLGAKLISHPVPRKVSFTGSTSVGIQVAKAAADDLKRVTLELGGNDPAIVLADADIEAIAKDLFWSGFRNCGQICLAAKRIYVAASLREPLTEALAELARSTRVGNGLIDGVELGPLNNRPQLERVEGLVEDARRRGARVVAGGSRPDAPGYFYSPTIVDRIEDGTALVDEEQFGPAMPVIAFADERDAIEAANRLPYGLTASIWSSDVEHALEIANHIDSGQVSINAHGRGVTAHLPFGGHKLSGLGVENGPWGLDSFLQLQTVTAPARRTM